MDDWSLLQPFFHSGDFDAEEEEVADFIGRYRLPADVEALALKLLQLHAPIGSGRYNWGSITPEDMVLRLTELHGMAHLHPLGFNYYDLAPRHTQAVKVLTTKSIGLVRIRTDTTTQARMVFMRAITTDLIPLAEAGRARRIEYCGRQRSFA